MTHRWMQSVRAENFRRFANRQYRRDLARQLVHQTCAQAIGVIERIAQSDAGQAELFPDAKFPKVILPTELVVWDLEQRRIARSNRAIVPGCRLATAPGESISAGTLRAAAGALRSLSDKLNVISQRLENAGRTLEFTARLAP